MGYKHFLLTVKIFWTMEKELMNIVMDVEQNISNTTNYICIDPPCKLSGNLEQCTLETIIG